MALYQGGQIIASRYWNTNGIGISIVAITGYANYVTAYIGACPEGAQHEDTAHNWAARHGAKLCQEEALRMLPVLEAVMQELELQYRN